MSWLKKKAAENDKRMTDGDLAGYPSEASWHKGMKDPNLLDWEHELTRLIADFESNLLTGDRKKDAQIREGLIKLTKWVGTQLKKKEKAEGVITLLTKHWEVFPDPPKNSSEAYRLLNEALTEYVNLRRFVKQHTEWDGKDRPSKALDSAYGEQSTMIRNMRKQMQNYFRQFETLRDEAKTWKDKYKDLVENAMFQALQNGFSQEEAADIIQSNLPDKLPDTQMEAYWQYLKGSVEAS
jgi:hypothetical protein